MKYTKKFFSFEEQINLLEKRGIQFLNIDKKNAITRVSHINYFKFSGYIKNFEKGKDMYENVDFLEILDLYYFDKELRNLLFNAIEKIEISFKTKLAYYIAEATKEKGGISYVDLKTWVNKDKVIDKYDKKPWEEKDKIKFLKKSIEFKESICRYTARGGDIFVLNYFNKYEEDFLPIWMFIEIADFGKACDMYRIAKTDIRKKVAMDYGLYANDLDFYLKTIKLIRNISAHNGILWNIKLVNEINKDIIRKFDGKIENNKLIAVVLLIKDIIFKINEKYDFDRISNHLINYFEKYPKQLKKFGLRYEELNLLKELLK